ncbi:MAG: MerR family transcriptional regulator [Angelakisella sp.]
MHGYQIKEIAALFDLHPDTLRYYEEQGLIAPQRSANGYRSYSIQDVCALSIIRSLRRLEMPVEEISRYMAERTVTRTGELLEQQQALIDRRMAELAELRGQIGEKQRLLAGAADLAENTPRLVRLPARHGCCLRSPMILEADVDLHLKRLERLRPELFGKLTVNRRMGAMLEPSAVKKGIYNRFGAVFFLSEQSTDWQLPEGVYAVTCYRGDYTGLAQALPQLLEFVAGQGYAPAGLPLELYHVDVHDTRLVGEYLTEVQILVDC